MYVTTFYSFKGGVGRSMALANAAVELAKRGRRVLAVDFDLEAPGLDTFDALRPRDEVPGIIDFVHDYLDSNRAPDAREFLSELPAVGDRGGGLWIMPSGARKPTYAARFNDIDWVDLYEKRDGYLLFEDLKAQWEQAIHPDYVLIDSRTGHTDTGGICTRQLPDAVAILFFPNEQNLQGLTKVVRDVRAEARGPRGKQIDLHFVMSNVPDLDDEDRILEAKIDAFRDGLGFRGKPLVVHRYDSLSLLNQVVFTKDRPRSRLANEYRRIVRGIVSRNLEDRDGALDYVERMERGWHRRRMRESPEAVGRKLREIEKLGEIEKLHSHDGEVLFTLGAFYEDDRRPEQAAALINRAIKAGYDEPEAYLRRARLRADLDAAGARRDASRVLQVDGLPSPLVREAVRLAMSGESGNVAQSPAILSLDADERVWLAIGLENSPREIEVAAAILEPLVEDGNASSETRAMARGTLALRYVGIGKCSAAIELLRRGGRDVGGMDVQDAFNFGMATWGATGGVVAAPFVRVVELDRSDPERDRANYLQCMAVAFWATGDAAAALDFVDQARKALGVKRVSTFSCWRYRNVPPNVFMEDLGEIEALIRGDDSRTPRFMNPAKQQEATRAERVS